MPGSSSFVAHLLQAAISRYFWRGLIFACLMVGLYTLAHLEGRGFSGAVAALPGAVNLSMPLPVSESEERVRLAGFVQSNPDNLLKMTGGDVLKLFSSPQLSWHEAPTVFWQYKTDHCILDIYMASMSEEVEHAPVVHYEQRSRIQGVSSLACAQEITASL